jgi:Fe-S cluster biosynthesis and repair protein YggX
MQNPSAKGLLVLSSEISQELKSSLRQQSHIDVWDGKDVRMMLSQHPDISNTFQSLQTSRQSFISQVAFLTGPPTNRASELCSEMRKLPCGAGHWKDYERICTEILTYVFSPDLAAPEIQSRSDDGLDIIDAIFPIRSNAAPWSIVRAEYRTRFAVAEFKNYCGPIGQRQVESIAQYLWDKAHRTFGILVSRKNASQSATAQRRRQWLESSKMIVLLSDDDLCEMLNMKESGGQPFDIIDSQLEDFLRTLTP